MRAVLQRVKSAQVSVSGEVCGSCADGWFILLGVASDDEKTAADALAKKIAALRLFEDENGKLNLDMRQIGGSALVVSNFTLCADCRHGNRPSFTSSASGETALPLYEYFVKRLREESLCPVETGSFGADMVIETVCSGPVTVVLNAGNDGKIC